MILSRPQHPFGDRTKDEAAEAAAAVAAHDNQIAASLFADLSNGLRRGGRPKQLDLCRNGGIPR